MKPSFRWNCKRNLPSPSVSSMLKIQIMGPICFKRKEHPDILSSCILPSYPLGHLSYPWELLLFFLTATTPTCVTRWLAICCCGCWTCWGCWDEGCCWDCPTIWLLIVCWPLGGLYIAGVPSGFTNGWPETKHPAFAEHFKECFLYEIIQPRFNWSLFSWPATTVKCSSLSMPHYNISHLGCFLQARQRADICFGGMIFQGMGGRLPWL